MKAILKLLRINIEAVDDFLSIKMLLSLMKISFVILGIYIFILIASYVKAWHTIAMDGINIREEISIMEKELNKININLNKRGIVFSDKKLEKK